ncbi:MAG: hypothetical protein ABIR71_03570 [Chthoniobacterales bacterium]
MRSWYAHLLHEWTVASRRPLLPAFAQPTPETWDDNRLTAAWLGHATVLMNFCGIRILTDPVLLPRIGVRLPGFTIGPKRLTQPALRVTNYRRSISFCCRTRISTISICARCVAYRGARRS